jgi:hypothetical protein
MLLERSCMCPDVECAGVWGCAGLQAAEGLTTGHIAPSSESLSLGPADTAVMSKAHWVISGVTKVCTQLPPPFAAVYTQDSAVGLGTAGANVEMVVCCSWCCSCIRRRCLALGLIESLNTGCSMVLQGGIA